MKRWLSLLVCIFVFASLAIFVFPARAQTLQKKDNACDKNFNMDKILDSKDPLKNKDKQFKFLETYFRCRGIAEDGFFLKHKGYEEFKKDYLRFNSYIFWRHFMLQGTITIPLLNECLADTKTSLTDCQAKLQAFLRNDPSICKNDNGCIAVMTLNPDTATNTDDKDMVYYLQALRKLDAAPCDKIVEPVLAMACRAVLANDMKKCEAYPDFKTFKSNYCMEYKSPAKEQKKEQKKESVPDPKSAAADTFSQIRP
jgi:hypothetical protein